MAEGYALQYFSLQMIFYFIWCITLSNNYCGLLLMLQSTLNIPDAPMMMHGGGAASSAQEVSTVHAA